MKCSQAIKRLHLYVDRRLDPRSLMPLEQHLYGCAACCAELRMLEMIGASVEGLESAPEPPALTEQTMRRIAAYEAEKASQAARARQKRARRHARHAIRQIEGVRALKPVTAPPQPGWIGWLSGAAVSVGPRRLTALAVIGAALIVWAYAGFSINTVLMAPSVALRLLPQFVQLLLSPGPEQIAWGVWVGAALVVSAGITWFARASVYADWRRSLAERLPQLPWG
ncbi:MAG: zf-HC2 domain-containing protein [Ktedonobacterales bacterium]